MNFIFKLLSFLNIWHKDGFRYHPFFGWYKIVDRRFFSFWTERYITVGVKDVTPDNRCKACVFNKGACATVQEEGVIPFCTADKRKDGYNVFFISDKYVKENGSIPISFIKGERHG